MGLITEERNAGAGNERPGLGRRNRVESDEAEITLGMRSLLGIFFALVLICGIFFGLGYSVGRSGGTRAAAQDETTAANAAVSGNLKKPSAQQTEAPALAPVAAENPQSADNPAATTAQSATQAAGPGATPAQPAAAGVVPAPMKRPVETAAPATTTTAQRAVGAPAFSAPPNGAGSVQPVAAPASTYMVQIAAVRLQQDASVLVSALTRRGYNVVVRNEPQDALLHVQIGPFSTRAQAFDMRSKLLADGYNAVVK